MNLSIRRWEVWTILFLSKSIESESDVARELTAWGNCAGFHFIFAANTEHVLGVLANVDILGLPVAIGVVADPNAPEYHGCSSQAVVDYCTELHVPYVPLKADGATVDDCKAAILIAAKR